MWTTVDTCVRSKNMAKILHVEDDVALAKNVSQWFETQGHTCETANNGKDALQLLEHFQYDIILLDWNLPDLDGVDICSEYRKKGGSTYIIFLTGKGELADKEAALDLGGDDYLTKPFHIRELAARVRSALRRPAAAYQASLRIQDVSLDAAQRTVTVADKSIRLMPKEVALLEYLMRHPNQVFGAKKLISAVWPSESAASEGTVRTSMLNLRKKLEAAGKPDFVSTVLGEGYTIKLDSPQ